MGFRGSRVQIPPSRSVEVTYWQRISEGRPLESWRSPRALCAKGVQSVGVTTRLWDAPEKRKGACRSVAPSFDAPVRGGRNRANPTPQPPTDEERAMRFMIIIKANERSEAGVMPS